MMPNVATKAPTDVEDVLRIEDISMTTDATSPPCLRGSRAA